VETLSKAEIETDKSGVPYDGSKLEPHTDLIFKLRGQKPRPVGYRKIAAKLFDEHGLKTVPSNIHNFVKVRSKKQRKVIAMLPEFSSPKPAPAKAAVPSAPNLPEDKWARIDALKTKSAPLRQEEPTGFDESKPLTLLNIHHS
jgi:hypothetical protein